MKFEIPKIVEQVPMSEYAPEFGETVLHVWVNPPRELRFEYDQLCQRVSKIFADLRATDNPEIRKGLALELDRTTLRIDEILAELWSQGPEHQRWSVAEIQQLAESDTDPLLLPWMLKQTLKKIAEHRTQIKKN